MTDKLMLIAATFIGLQVGWYFAKKNGKTYDQKRLLIGFLAVAAVYWFLPVHF